jgi:hypothetical protein
MFATFFSFRRRHAPQPLEARVDRRSGTPKRRVPEPMPRMRWYS